MSPACVEPPARYASTAEPLILAAVSAMAEAMSPRGPDGAGAWSAGRVALGHRRLKIIDLTEAGGQPMVDSDLGLAIAWNGCIYNYPELRRELSDHGYRFFSTSDTEVMLKAYHRWGDRFVDHLKGMFAFAIVERESGRVLLGRDRLGIKPLYITEDAHRIRFASSLPALVAGGASTPTSTRSRCTTTSRSTRWSRRR